MKLLASDRLTIVSFEATNEATARDQQRLDINDEICALVIINSDDAIREVEGNFIPDAQGNTITRKGNETWVYLTAGSIQVRLFPEHHLPLMVNFRDYNIRSLKGGVTYRLKLSGGEKQKNKDINSQQTIGTEKDADVSGNYLIVETTQKNAEFYVDNVKLDRDEDSGLMSIFLEKGKHSYVAKCPYCFEQNGEIEIKDDPIRMKIDLVPLGKLYIKYSPADAKLYINDKEEQTNKNGSFSKNFAIGDYTWRLEAKGCESKSGKISLGQGETDLAIVLPLPKIPTDGLQNGQKKEFEVNGVKFNMIFVSGGSFTMGHVGGHDKMYYFLGGHLDPEQNSHRVNLSSFWIAETEVTQQLWNAVMGEKYTDSKIPAYTTYWNAYTFINKLSELTGTTFRMPTEAQWEYAAKGGCNSMGYYFSGSNNINEVGICKEKDPKYKKESDVAQKKPNELGLYDMSGNLEEMVYDNFKYYDRSSSSNPIVLIESKEDKDIRITRGGDYYHEKNCTVCKRLCITNGMKAGIRLAIY